jgi:peptidoglycan pentaglycine glycine transferase (the first glycine)
MQLQEISDQYLWDAFIDAQEYGRPLQLWEWGELKRQNGWVPHRVALVRGGTMVAAAQVLVRPIPMTPRSIAYIPRGPVVAPSSQEAMELLTQIGNYFRAQGAILLKMEPAWLTADLPANWRRAHQSILLGETYTIDLSRPEDQIVASMRSKTRQYIRKAQTDGVEISRDEKGEYLPAVYEIYQQTAKRAGFGLHSFSYYQRLFELFGNRNYLFVAQLQGQPVAFLWLIVGGGSALELYGGVNDTGAESKANYLLKSRAITELKAAGYKLYDFNGRLNEGVSQFKAGFGPDETNYVGSYDWPLRKFGYWLWTGLLPVLKPVARKLMGGRSDATG